MVNLLHHVTDAEAFFAEARRVLRQSGLIAMIEPYVTPFSRLVYRYLHHEPFDPQATEWKLPPSGRLSGGNDALPWIMLVRDRGQFESRFPELRIEPMRPHSSLSHLLSGGVTTRALAPVEVIRALRKLEDTVPQLMQYSGLFFTVVLRRL
jgi:hypothetical protein